MYPTRERLNYLFKYEPNTGLLLSKHCRLCRAPDAPIFSTHCEGYLTCWVDGKSYLMHRLVWIYFHGFIPLKREIDHIDGNRSNNKIENLRLVTRGENNKNSRLYSNNTSGTAGVSFDKRRKRWRARINVCSKVICLGDFDKKSDAVRARKQAEVQYRFSSDHGKDDRMYYMPSSQKTARRKSSQNRRI